MSPAPDAVGADPVDVFSRAGRLTGCREVVHRDIGLLWYVLTPTASCGLFQEAED